MIFGGFVLFTYLISNHSLKVYIFSSVILGSVGYIKRPGLYLAIAVASIMTLDYLFYHRRKCKEFFNFKKMYRIHRKRLFFKLVALIMMFTLLFIPSKLWWYHCQKNNYGGMFKALPLSVSNITGLWKNNLDETKRKIRDNFFKTMGNWLYNPYTDKYSNKN